MKIFIFLLRPAISYLIAATLIGGCSGRADALGVTQGPVIDGEHFTVRIVIDRGQRNIPVATFIAPEKWPDNSQVIWNYAHTSNPVTAAVSAENPANEEAFYLYPNVELFWLRPVSNYYLPGQNYGGLIFAQPLSPESALSAF